MARRASAKQLLKAQDRFRAALIEYIISKGARTGRFYDFEMDTPAGLLHLSVYGNWIATRFDDVALGRRFCDCNPFSGKWNFHFGFDGTVVSLDPEKAIAHFGSQLERLLAWEPTGVSAVQE